MLPTWLLGDIVPHQGVIHHRNVNIISPGCNQLWDSGIYEQWTQELRTGNQGTKNYFIQCNVRTLLIQVP